MRRDPDPPGVTYDGCDGIYHVLLHGQRVGHVVSGYDTWTAVPHDVKQWKWVAPTRRQATAGLIAWLEEQP